MKEQSRFTDWLDKHPEYDAVYKTPIEDVDDEHLDQYLEIINFISRVKEDLKGD